MSVYSAPSRRTGLPTTSARPPSRSRQNVLAAIATGGVPGLPSASLKSRPIIGCLPRTEKNPHDTTRARRSSAVLPLVKLRARSV